MAENPANSQSRSRLAGIPFRFQDCPGEPLARVVTSRMALRRAGRAWERKRRVEVFVADDNGHTYRVPISLEDRHTMRWLALAGAIVLPLNWLLRRAWARRRLS